MLQKLKFIAIALVLAISFVDARTVFYGATKITVPVGASVDLKSPLYRIFARDDYDGDISEKIVMPTTTTINTSSTGTQKVNYSVKNSKNEEKKIEVSIVVAAAGSTTKIERTIYTLPASQLKNIELSGQGRGNGHDRQHLGVFMPQSSALKIKKVSDANMSTSLTVKMYQGLSDKDGITNNIWKNFSESQVELKNDRTMGGVPFIQTPRTDSDVLPVVEIEYANGLKELDYHHYKDNEDTFFSKWRTSNNKFALVGNRAVQLLVPTEDRDVLKQNKTDGYEPVQNVTTIDALLEAYDEMCEYFNEWSGLSSDETNPLHRLVRTKYFVLPQNPGAGAGYYGGDHCGMSGNRLGNYLGKAWILYHELGHGYDGALGGHSWYKKGETLAESEKGKIGEVINNVFGHNYQMTYLDLSKPEDQYYSWTLNYPGWGTKPADDPGHSWESLNARAMGIRDKTPNKTFDKGEETMGKNAKGEPEEYFYNTMYPNGDNTGDNYRDKLAAVIMVYSAIPGDYGDAMAHTYRFIRETKAKGISLRASDYVAKGMYNAGKLNVIPVMDLFGWTVSDDMRREIFQSGDAKIPYNLHYLTSNAAAQSATLAAIPKLLSKHSLVLPENISGRTGNATITISNADVNGKKVKINNGTTFVAEATVSSNKAEFTNIPVGAYSIELPQISGKVQDYTKSFVIITDGQTVAGQTVNAQTIPYVGGTAPVFKSLTPAKISVEIGKIIALTATIENGFEGNTVWESSDESVATITSSGVIIGVSTGTVTITATNSEQTKTAEITVIPPLVSADISRARVNTWSTKEGTISTSPVWGNLFDNELSTIWHGRYDGVGSGGAPEPKAEGFVDLDLGEEKTFLAVEVDKRIGTNQGAIKALRVFIHDETGDVFPNGESMSSLTAENVAQTAINADFKPDGWTGIEPALLSGLLNTGASAQTVKATLTEPLTARYVRLGITAVGSDGLSDYVQVAEIRVLEEGEPMVAAQIPTITKNLESSFEITGGSSILSVEANVSDGGTLSYIWYKDGEKLDKTGNEITVTQSGEYFVVIKNTKNGIPATVRSNKCAVTKGEMAINDNIKKSGKMLFKSTIVSDKMEIVLDKEFVDIRFTVYDFTGNVVSEGFQRGDRKAPLSWNLKNKAGRFVANGSYQVVVEARDRNGVKYHWSDKLGVKR